MVIFDTTAPGTTVSTVQVSGLAAGEVLGGIDYRYTPIAAPEQVPPPPGVFGLGVTDGAPMDTVRLYAIDLLAGIATPVGPGHEVTGGSHYGFDFNPAVDRVRVVNDADENMRINPNNGARADSPTNDTDLNPAGSQVSAVAYDRVHVPAPPAGPVTAYAISATGGTLVTLGGINQIPSPNSGQLLNAKPLGLPIAPGSPVSLDISLGGAAYATLTDSLTGQSNLYAIDLNSGAPTSLGPLPGTLSGFSLVPQSALPPVPVAPAPPPTVSLAGVRTKMSFSAFLKGVTFKVTPSEPAAILAQLLGAKKKKKKGAPVKYTKVLATRSVGLKGGQQSLTLKPRRKLLGKPNKAFKVHLEVAATAANGNVGKATKTIRVSPPKKKKKRKS